jgi:uncharacterized protein involved in outer membrane biogenesis
MGRLRFSAKSVRIAAAAVFVAGIATLVVPFLIPIDSYRPLLVWAVESATGRNVQIDSLKLFFLPTLHIRVANFRLKNPAGFPAGDAIVASSVDLGIAPQALLSRRLDVTYIAPSGVQVNVLRDAKGRSNFAVPIAARSAGPPAPVFTLEQVGAVRVKDAEITFADALTSTLPAPAFALRGVSGTIGSIDTQAPDWAKRLQIDADLRGAQLTLSNLNKPIDFHTGQLTIKAGAARSTFSLSVGNVDLAGAAAFARLDPLLISFAVTGPELDFKSLATFLAGAHGSAVASSAKRRLLAHGTIKIGKVVFSPLAASQLNGELEIYTSAVRLNAWTVSAYGGTVHGNAELIGSAGAPIAVTAQAHGLNVPQLLVAIGSPATSVTGTLDANFRLTTLLARDPEQSLQATGTFAVRNGSFPSIAFKGLTLPSGDSNFSSFGGDLRIARERGYSSKLTMVASEMQATSSGSFGFDQSLQYSGHGVVDPATQATSLTSSPLLASLQPILAGFLQKGAGVARVSVPFTLRGTLSSPQFALAGTPQLIASPSSGQAAQLLPTTAPAVQDLMKLIPGL